jgi:hypothetical protein
MMSDQHRRWQASIGNDTDRKQGTEAPTPNSANTMPVDEQVGLVGIGYSLHCAMSIFK